MDMLADGVGRGADLKIVQFKVLGQFVGVAELDAFARQGAEEEGLL